MNPEPNFIPYHPTQSFTDKEMIVRSKEYFEKMNQRRSLRMFSDKPVPKEVIQNLIQTASTAPSGANKQPWTFCAISNPEIKKQIREAAEQEEYISYNGRMSAEWIQDLQPFGTDWHKEFLEIAPWLIVVFKKIYDQEENLKKNNYYVVESVGLATGFLLTAIHHTGLVALTHTPSPMNFLSKILQRPENEKPFLLIPVGFPAENAEVPNIQRKELEKISIFYE
jgi:nitroreductase